MDPISSHRKKLKKKKERLKKSESFEGYNIKPFHSHVLNTIFKYDR
jgi:hypothetical protein